MIFIGPFYMNYPDTISYLFGLRKFGIKLGLNNIRSLLKQLGDPQKRLRCIHIAGSNGKGSTAAFLLSILKHSGYKTGLYTSPHLIDFTERIRLNDREIQRAEVVRLTRKIRAICKRSGLNNITFFEFVTALAFKFFEQESADPVIVEVGLGGRFDATNVIKPLLSIVTSISMEHQLYLGRTLSDIAREKAGIIKKKVPVISAVQPPQARNYIRNKCNKLDSPLYQLGQDVASRKLSPAKFNYNGLHLHLKQLQCGLLGDHQIRNASLAITACEVLSDKNFHITAKGIAAGIQKTVWPGRLEIIRRNSNIVLDGAHNPAAWKALRKAIETYFQSKRIFLLLGVMDDKDISRMIHILAPLAYAIIFCRPNMERAAKKNLLEQRIHFSIKKKVFWVEKPSFAIDKALRMASKQDLICVTGSLFVVGEIRQYLTQVENASGRIGM